jgi:hypothetical protein
VDWTFAGSGCRVCGGKVVSVEPKFMAEFGWIVYSLGFVVASIIVWSLFGYPRWNVWAMHQSGLADLAAAKNEQQIQIAKAQSRLDAAELNKKAAIIEAQAVAEQITAIGTQLTAHDLYLRWQWIKMMEDTHEDADRSVIYVPTEAQIPILEARRKT